MRLLLFLVLMGLVLPGCRHPKPVDDPFGQSEPKKSRRARADKQTQQTTTKPPPRVVPLNELVGKVASVNPLGFVVVDFPLGQLPPVDQRLGVYRQGQKVAEVKITGPAMDTAIAADILAGEAQVGDEVRSR